MSEQNPEAIISSLYAKARDPSRQLVGWYDKVFQQVSSRERSQETLVQLRQLFYIVLVNTDSPDVPIHLIEILSHTAVDSERETLKLRWLCAAILRDLAPIPSLPSGPLSSDPSTLPLVLPFLLQQGAEQRQINHCASQLARVLSHPSPQELEVLAPSLACLCSLHHALPDLRLMGSDEMNALNKQLGTWLRFAPKTQLTGGFPLTKMQKKQPKNFVKELDGAPCQDFFTCLNLASSYAGEQMLNVVSWSIMRRWMECTYGQWEAVEVLFLASRGSTPSMSGRESPLTQSANTSPPDTTPSSSPVPFNRMGASFINESMDGGGLGRFSTSNKVSSNTFQDRIVEYCQRVIDQSQRKPLKKEDDEVLQACLVEAVVLINRVCLKDGSLSSKLSPSLKRLLVQSSDRERVLLHLIEFFLHHGDDIAFDTQKALDSFFGATISHSFQNHGLAMDSILFGLRNADTLRTGSVFTRYFPNWLKILAWSPVTFVQDFQQLLPHMLTPSTAVELLHFLLDLPCLAAALQAQQYSKDGIAFSDSVQACQEHSYQFVFNFLLRNESGQCDTIDKLDSLLLLLSDMSSHPRVLATCDVTPLLLSRYFQAILSANDKSLASKVIPVVLERSRQLYNVTEFRRQVRSELQTALLHIFRQHSDILMDHASELLEFVGQHSSLSAGNDEFFSYVVFLVGEYARAQLDARCCSETYDQFYEVFESLAYEVSASIYSRSLHQRPQGGAFSAKLVVMLLTAMSKLASRSQTLIPRVILCIRKVDQQTADSSLPAYEQRILSSRASQLISTLRLPNIASIVFNPPLHLHLPGVVLNQVSTAQYLTLINSELSATHALRS